MVIASYIWMKWYALLQFTASASYFIQQPFISFPAELFRNKFRHLINSWSDSGNTRGKKKSPGWCRFTLFKIIFHNKGAIGGALSQQRGRDSFSWGRRWFEDKLSVSLVPRKKRRGFWPRFRWEFVQAVQSCFLPHQIKLEGQRSLFCLQFCCVV